MKLFYRFALLAAASLTFAAPVRAQMPADSAVATAQPEIAQTRPVRRSWTADRREFEVGDVITVLIDEYTLASANKTTSASDRRRRDLDFAASGTGLAGSLPAAGARVGTINDADSRQRGDAVRQNSFRGEMSVRVVAVDPNGVLQIQGQKLVNVDKNREEVTLTGWVRPQDVSSQNLVDSRRIGDAQLAYASKGSLGKPKSGILSRVLGAIWP
jgi:flagellar L-ring protein precursor FlgH